VEDNFDYEMVEHTAREQREKVRSWLGTDGINCTQARRQAGR